MTPNKLPTSMMRLTLRLKFAVILLLVLQAGQAYAQTLPADSGSGASAVGPGLGAIRLKQSDQPLHEERQPPVAAAAYVPGEFELFVRTQAGGADIRRFGAELVTSSADARTGDSSPLVPAEYVVSQGDELLITIWGSVDADLRLIVDRSGRISIPRVGPIQVSGVRNADIEDVVRQRLAQVFKNFQVSVSLGQLRGIRVFVTGFVIMPGSYVVSSLSTVVSALMRAGGPSAAGSFRNISLRRGNRVVSSFDFYDLLLRGDRSADQTIQAGDVVHVGPVGTQVGFVGSVNKAAVLELKSGESVSDALLMVGGFSAVADRGRLAIERLQERTTLRVVQLELPQDERMPLSNGDVLRAFSAVEAALPSQRRAKRVRIEGEVEHPGEYVLPENSSVADAVRIAGGFTSQAYIFGTEFTRERVRATQQENYDRALRDLETDIARASSSQRVSTGEEATSQSANSAAGSRLIGRLRGLRPSGRIVLQLVPGTVSLPDLALEDGDRIVIPPKPNTVGVFGSVFNAASYLYGPDRSLADYLRLAGGPTSGADEDSIFVIRGDGSVTSNRQGATWLGRDKFGTLQAEPGDTIFVPEQIGKTTLVQGLKDWTQILYQFGIGLAGIKSAIR
jgi:protein involved in polysaccharide export with SLBB domain